MTAHINAPKEKVAKLVLMAGDPKRVKTFVEKYLENYELINDVRDELGYTGYLNGKRISVFSHGMGLDSSGIYTYELFAFYDVDYIIRFGSAGTYSKDINLFDVIIAKESYNESNYGLAYDNESHFAKPSSNLLNITRDILKNDIDFKEKTNYKESIVHSSHWFYTKPNFIDQNKMVEQGINVVEMEAYAIYTIAKYLKKEALVFLTISDSLVTNERLTSDQRVSGFNSMFDLLKKIVEKIDI